MNLPRDELYCLKRSVAVVVIRSVTPARPLLTLLFGQLFRALGSMIGAITQTIFKPKVLIENNSLASTASRSCLAKQHCSVVKNFTFAAPRI